MAPDLLVRNSSSTTAKRIWYWVTFSFLESVDGSSRSKSQTISVRGSELFAEFWERFEGGFGGGLFGGVPSIG